ncbi:Arylsulfatase [Planctomycetes bacterium Pan216]|uniref:Arylsulfatase n=1 Tax=Kolteria novifilia TaxID=2527975 RepID=A0A518BB64_9BACT|nr:Arylsulfatase [Planctomycetes bacterium Pan216]
MRAPVTRFPQHRFPHQTPTWVGLIAVAFLALGAHDALGAEEVEHPNVLLILTDDQGWGDLGSHGNEVLETPVLDKLAAEGVTFDRFYVSPVCAPTRASVLTGRYHARTGVSGVTHGLEVMNAEEVTIAELLGKAGYATGCFGKWHNGSHYPFHPNGQGFEEFVGFCAGHWTLYFDTQLEHNGNEFKSRGYISDVLTDRAIGFMEANREKPFLCYVPYNAPHSPFQVPDTPYDKYRLKGLDPELATVYGMVENLDHNIGRMLSTLDDLGLREKTIVIFLTDNGPNTKRYNGGMLGRKGSTDEGGVRVPCIISWPGHLKPRRVEPLAAHIDLLPTIMQLCHVAVPSSLKLDGVSLVPLLEGKTEGWPERTLFHRYARRGKDDASMAVRTSRHRMSRKSKKQPWRLYDMHTDPGQKENIAKENPAIVDRLGKAYAAWEKDVTKGGFGQRPIEVGHSQSPAVSLLAPEAQMSGLHFHGKTGWANDWLQGFTSPEATATWPLEVAHPGTYDVTIYYTCPAKDVGKVVEARVGDANLEKPITRAFDPEEVHGPNRVGRKEVGEKKWAALPMGSVTLPRGETKVVLSVAKPATDDFSVKRVEIRKVK